MEKPGVTIRLYSLTGAQGQARAVLLPAVVGRHHFPIPGARESDGKPRLTTWVSRQAVALVAGPRGTVIAQCGQSIGTVVVSSNSPADVTVTMHKKDAITLAPGSHRFVIREAGNQARFDVEVPLATVRPAPGSGITHDDATRPAGSGYQRWPLGATLSAVAVAAVRRADGSAKPMTERKMVQALGHLIDPRSSAPGWHGGFRALGWSNRTTDTMLREAIRVQMQISPEVVSNPAVVLGESMLNAYGATVLSSGVIEALLQAIEEHRRAAAADADDASAPEHTQSWLTNLDSIETLLIDLNNRLPALTLEDVIGQTRGRTRQDQP
jgi:hypothetical protein